MSVVSLAHGGHEERNERYEHKDDPSTGSKLCNGNDDKHDTSDGSADTIEERLTAPAFTTKLPPMHHHAGLADGETEEDADRICRDQQCDQCVGCNQKDDCASCNGQDSARVCETITPLTDLAGEESITRQDACKLRTTVEPSVCSQQQDSGRCNLEDGVRDPVPKGDTCDLRDQRLTANLLWNLAEREGEQRHSKEDRGEKYRHDCHRVCGIFCFWLLERSNAVGDCFGASQRNRSVRKGFQKKEWEDELHAVMRLNNNTLAPVHCRIAERDADETNPDHRDRTANKEVGRNSKEATGLAEAAQVCEDQEEEGTERHLYAPRQELRER